jgi:hypothetical protein
MRHRIGCADCLGIGNPAPCKLGNHWIGDAKRDNAIKGMLKNAISLYFSDIGGLDFEIGEDVIAFGIEPAYQWDEYFVIEINKDKGRSSISRGVAFGLYGSSLGTNTKYYKDYKKNSKFTRFIDKWHDVVFKRRGV